jgi:hypothetical protein
VQLAGSSTLVLLGLQSDWAKVAVEVELIATTTGKLQHAPTRNQQDQVPDVH